MLTNNMIGHPWGLDGNRRYSAANHLAQWRPYLTYAKSILRHTRVNHLLPVHRLLEIDVNKQWTYYRVEQIIDLTLTHLLADYCEDPEDTLEPCRQRRSTTHPPTQLYKPQKPISNSSTIPTLQMRPRAVVLAPSSVPSATPSSSSSGDWCGMQSMPPWVPSPQQLPAQR